MSQGPTRLALTIGETSAALAVSPRTVRRLIAAGELEPLRIGRAVRISTADLARWITANSTARATLDTGTADPEEPTCHEGAVERRHNPPRHPLCHVESIILALGVYMHRDSISQRIGQAVRSRRKNAGMTQADLASKAGIVQSFVGQIERAERNMTVGVLADVAEALNVEPADLLRDVERLT